MTFDEKVNLVETLVDDSTVTESVISAYLSLSLAKIMERLYPFDHSASLVLPSKYDVLHCELAARMIARRGGEGELIHNENGIQRTYGTVDDEDILSRLTPMMKIVGQNEVV